MRKIKGALTKDQYIEFLREERAALYLGDFYQDIRIGNWNSDGQYTVVDSGAPGLVKEMVLSHLREDGWTVERKELESPDSREWHDRQSIVVFRPKLDAQLVELK
jgi:hypothetical protein